mgnify:CR=1 FL=1
MNTKKKYLSICYFTIFASVVILKSMIMAQNEETLYFDNIHPEVRQESKDKTQNAADKATFFGRK